MSNNVLFVVTPGMRDVFARLKKELPHVVAFSVRPRSKCTALPDAIALTTVRPVLTVFLVGSSEGDQAIGLRALTNLRHYASETNTQPRHGVVSGTTFMTDTPEHTVMHASFWVSLNGRTKQLVTEALSRIKRALEGIQPDESTDEALVEAPPFLRGSDFMPPAPEAADERFLRTVRGFGVLLGNRSREAEGKRGK